jgi:DNA mismatch repair protein MutL
MNRIRLLPEHVANQIAAGEVVERPASVVKELVENALDAQATRITVEIQAGGRSLVRVTDDGLGMSRDDALLCFERHATSKIERAEDLSAIATMGFRGEALPSIASVSRLSLTTRERASQSPAATQVIIHGGKLLEVKEAGAPDGTALEIRQLFYNLPARRKFLRSEETEYAHIHHYVALAALANPHVAFNFSKDGRPVWQLPGIPRDKTSGHAALRERMRALFGAEQKLVPVDFSAELDSAEEGEDDLAHAAPDPRPAGFRIWGFIGQPGVSRSTREDQHLFVNRRPVENRGLNFALIEGYHTALMKGRYPVCCLFLEVDPATVDVNIHPAKREVKFHNERAVRQFTAQAVREALLAFHTQSGGQPVSSPAPTGVAAASLATPPSAAPVTPAVGIAVPQEFTSFDALTGTPLTAPAKARLSAAQASPAAQWAEVKPQTGPMPAALKRFPGEGEASQPEAPPSAAPVHSASVSPTTSATPAPAGAPARDSLPLLNIPLRLVGVIGRLYVVLESDRGLVLMDQHAAHERILFEQMLNRLEAGEVPAQRLLLPETVELSVRDAQFLREQLPALARLGVGLSEFGEQTFLLDALPPMVKAPDPRRFVLELVVELKAAGEQVNSQRLGEQVIAKTVCRHAVKANDPLEGPELENLVNDLRQCAMPYTCPHGRPTLIEMSHRELEKKFGRLA